MEICFSLYSNKYLKENLSFPVTVFDRPFRTNFNFGNMSVFDLLCISSVTKNLLPLAGKISTLFSSSFIRTVNFFCSVVTLLSEIFTGRNIRGSQKLHNFCIFAKITATAVHVLHQFSPEFNFVVGWKFRFSILIKNNFIKWKDKNGKNED